MINDDLIDEVLNQFQDDKVSMAKPMFQQPLPTGRYYYPRPTPAFVLFEKNSMNSALSYDSRSIYNWNIDGQSDYQIMTTL